MAESDFIKDKSPDDMPQGGADRKPSDTGQPSGERTTPSGHGFDQHETKSFTQPVVSARKATFQQLGEPEKREAYDRPIDLILDVPLLISVELGRKDLTIREILELAPGSIIELDQLAGEPVDLMVNGKLFARGEVVVIDENFGVRVTNIISPQERLEKMR